MSMTEQQARAHGHPCFEAEETTHPRFHRPVRTPRHTATVILTANIGLE
jgi:hypothetical protein